MLTAAQKKLLANHRYSGKEMLAHPESGYAQSAEDWAEETDQWSDKDMSIEDQFASLKDITEDLESGTVYLDKNDMACYN